MGFFDWLLRRKTIKPKVNPDFIKWMGLQTPNTPDISVLEESRFQLVFAVDNLMYAGTRYPVIAESSAKGDRGFTRHKFLMYSDGKDGAVPLKAGDNPVNMPRQIKGEVHVVEAQAFPKLDSSYDNGVQYQRVRVPILVPYRHYEQVNNGLLDATGKPLPPALQGVRGRVSGQKVCILQAWMYIGKRSYWDQKLDGGYNHPQIPHFTPENAHPCAPTFFKFPKNGIIKDH